MKRFLRRVVAISSLALVGTAVATGPVTAAQKPGKDPYTTVEQVNRTDHLAKGEACNFAVTVQAKGTFVHFEKGRRVVDTTTGGSAVITNDRTSKYVTLNTNSVFSDHYAKDGNSTHSNGIGNQLFFGDMTFSKNGPKARIVYIQGKTRFQIRNAQSEENGYFKFTSVKGKFRDICKELSR